MTLFAIWSSYDMIIVAFIALLLFGNRLPSMMRSLGQGVNEFKKGMSEIPESDVKKIDTPPKLDDRVVNS